MNSLAIKLARSELSRGLKGFWIYLACLALGTAAIAAAGSVAESFSRGLASEARTLLGAGIIMVAQDYEHPGPEVRTLDEGVTRGPCPHHRFLSFSDEGHSISKWRNRLEMWRTIEDTLASCLGGASAGFDRYELMPTPGTVTRLP